MLLWTRRLLAGLNILNWLLGILIIAALGYVAFIAPDLFVERAMQWQFSNPDVVLQWMRRVTILTAPVILLSHLILTRLIAIIDDLRLGSHFASANAQRLRHIPWSLLGIQLIDLAFGLASMDASARTGEYFGWSLGLTGWLATLLLFVLAQVFERGAAMQEELAGTV